MNKYQVKAIRGKEVSLLSISAFHADDAFAQVKAKGYIPLATHTQSSSISKSRNKKFPLDLFSQELLALLDAGLNLVEAIETLAEKEIRVEVKRSLDTLIIALHEGQTFSSALAMQPENFPTLYVATIKASEKTGDLSEALGRYVRYEQQLGTLKKKIMSASIYPILLMAVGGLVIIFLLGFVVPKFSRIYEDNATNLPWLSQVLLAWGVFLENNAKAMLFTVAAFTLMMSYVLSLSTFRKWLMQLLWRIPALGERLRIFQLARFYRTLGMLLNGGTPVIAAMASVAGMLDVALQNKLNVATLAIQEGQTISVAMEQAGLTTPVALRMLRVGERGGSIGNMMERIAEFYDEELSRWIDWFTKLFEPILMLLIGLVIGVVVLLLYMPIFELAGNIQ